jgi:hypothetical protein
MIMVSWNSRGLGSRFKEDALRDLIRDEKPSMVLIEKTKLEEKEMLVVGKKHWKNSVGITISAREASRGVYTLWDSSQLILEFSQRTHCLTCSTSR